MVFLNYTRNHFPQKWFYGPTVHSTSNLRPGMVFSLENNGISRLKCSKIPSRSRDMKTFGIVMPKKITKTTDFEAKVAYFSSKYFI